jgi:hypothetical protein
VTSVKASIKTYHLMSRLRRRTPQSRVLRLRSSLIEPDSHVLLYKDSAEKWNVGFRELKRTFGDDAARSLNLAATRRLGRQLLVH